MPLDDAPVTAITPSLSACDREAVVAFVDALRGGSIDDSLFVVAALVDGGDWRPWMLPALLRVHRADVVELLRRVGPLITGAGAGAPLFITAITVDARPRHRLPVVAACCPDALTAP
jgi:hypothetical protein